MYTFIILTGINFGGFIKRPQIDLYILMYKIMKVLSVYLHIFHKHPSKNYFNFISQIPPGSLESTPKFKSFYRKGYIQIFG